MSGEPLSNFEQIEHALSDPNFASKYPGVANYQGYGSFLDVMRNLQTRITRLEMTVTLWLAPVRDCTLNRETFKRWLDDNWRTGSFASEYRHETSHVMVKLPNDGEQWAWGAELREVLLTIAAVEGRTPRDLLLEIDPNAFPSAIDALGATVRTD